VVVPAAKGSFDCVAVRFADDNSAQDDKDEKYGPASEYRHLGTGN
jgi:hypothetical protein